MGSMGAAAPLPQMTWVTDGGARTPTDRSGRIHHVDVRFLADETLPRTDVVIVDVDLRNPATVSQVRRLMTGIDSATRTIMAVERGSRVCKVQAYGLGASEVIGRPIERQELKACLERQATLPAGTATTLAGASPALLGTIETSANALRDIFAAFETKGELNLPTLAVTSDFVIDAVSQSGYAEWISTVRRHHEGTYQHCLIVTGTVALFACKTGMRRQDADTLTIAALLHDIGKADVPLAILDKPCKLDEEERAAIRRHPVTGHAYLLKQPGLAPAVLDAVLHHHEFLDGTGYPHGLRGSEIHDLTRIVTICDVYSALLERRSYKPPMAPRSAMKILFQMATAGKVELALVNALNGALGLQS